MPDRLVQKNSGFARGQHDLHGTGRRLLRVQHGDGQASRLAPVIFRRRARLGKQIEPAALGSSRAP
jgi:hypothetical protein